MYIYIHYIDISLLVPNVYKNKYMWKIMGNSDIAMPNSLAGAATWQSQAQTPSRPPLH